MTRLWTAGATALGLLACNSAFAQVTTFTIAPEHRTIIREYVTREGRPITITEQVRVGTVLPETVVISPFPDTVYGQVPEVKRYNFVHWGDQVVLVDPDTRKVVAIVN